LTWTIGEVELPWAPSRCTLRRPAKVEEFEQDGNDPIYMVPSSGGFELVLEGSLVGDKSTIMGSYVFPLMSQVGEVIEIDGSSAYDTTWLCVDFTWVEVNAKQVNYTIRLLMGAAYIIDGEEWED
jgi:hypothetical protein